MNHDHLEAISTVQKLAWALEDAKLDDSQCEVVVIPPFTDIRSVQTLVQGDKLWPRYGAQDVSRHEPGAHTGEIAATFLSRLGAPTSSSATVSAAPTTTRRTTSSRPRSRPLSATTSCPSSASGSPSTSGRTAHTSSSRSPSSRSRWPDSPPRT